MRDGLDRPHDVHARSFGTRCHNLHDAGGEGGEGAHTHTRQGFRNTKGSQTARSLALSCLVQEDWQLSYEPALPMLSAEFSGIMFSQRALVVVALPPLSACCRRRRLPATAAPDNGRLQEVKRLLGLR